MPIKTPHYQLEAFGWGDVYSARVDARRFTIIDNQLAFFSDLIGPGVITGWDLTLDNNGNAISTPGMGMIEINVFKTFGISEISVDYNSENYIYMRAKENEVGGISGNSEIVSVVGSNTIPPASPIGLQQESSIISYLAGLGTYDTEIITYLKRLLEREDNDDNVELIGYKEIAFSWTANEEIDFSHYKIVKIDGSSTFSSITTEVIYADTNLVQDNSYFYQIIAVDISGNESVASEIVVKTDVDTRVPLPPVFLEAFPSDGAFEIIWDESVSDNINSYEVTVQLLTDDYEEDGEAFVSYVSVTDNLFDSTYAIFTGLENSKNYRITVFSVSFAGIKSEGIYIDTKLVFSAGAGEVNSLDVTFEISNFENIGIETDISWRYQSGDPYLLDVELFLITFIENGVRSSDTIEILPSVAALRSCPDENNNDGDCYTTHIKYIPFENNGIISYESIKEYTPYVVLIQTKDADGNISSGFIYRVNRTPVSAVIPAVSNFVLTRRINNTIHLTWDNPEDDYFSYNTINVVVTDLSASVFNPSIIEDFTYSNNVRIGRSNEYIIPSSLFNINFRYTIIITPYDVFGSEGIAFEDISQFEDQAGIISPPSPGNLLVTAGDTEVNLKWDAIDDEFEIAYYRIYRAYYEFFQRPSDYAVIDTIPSTLNSFTDFTVSNGTSYNYFVTSVDIYDNESLNISSFGYTSIDSFSVEPRSNSSISAVSGLVINIGSDETSAELSWTTSAGNFDGYEILRSDENNYSFETVGYAFPSDTTFIDNDAILKNNASYYYIVRRFKNDSNIVVTSSIVVPSKSIFIGKVVSSNGVITFDTSGVVSLINFEDPIRERTEAKVIIHDHKSSNGFDRRLELRSNTVVDSWTTSDFSIYQTTEDIEGATNYVVRINGIINEDYFTDSRGNVDVARLRQAQIGESPIEFEIDVNEKIITFNEPLYTTCTPSTTVPIVTCPVRPYVTSEPVVSLELIGLSEVDNLLPDNKMESFSATQVSSGIIRSAQMPLVYHEGRINESLIPLKLPMQTFDNVSYSLSESYDDEDRNKMGNAITFYNIIATGVDEQLLAATSSGISVSDNFGNDWSKRETFPTAVHRVYMSAAGNFYAITNNNVYENNGTSFRSWRRMTGLEYVKIIRDITEDSIGNLYISTDLGVFRLNSESVPYIQDSWEKLSIFGVRSSEVYAIIVDEEFIEGSNGKTGRILASNELGLVESVDNGSSWSYVGDLEANVKIKRFIKSDNFIFALADDKLYRQEENVGDFVQIAEIDASLSIEMTIFNEKIYISTDNGAKVSVSSNIYTDTDIEFISVWSLINIKNTIPMVTSLSTIEGILFIGTDRRLFMFDSDSEIWLQYEQVGTVIPTIYIDDVSQDLGFYYNNEGANHNISFYETLSQDSIVKVSNKYDIYIAENGGWAENKYDAEFHISQNGIEFGRSDDIIPIDAGEFLDLTFPEYTDLNAHKEGADAYKVTLDGYITDVSSLTGTSGTEVVELVKNIYKGIELFFSQLYSSLTEDFVYPAVNATMIKTINVFSNLGEVETSNVSVYYEENQDRETDYSASINIANGLATFDIPFDKYDNIVIDISGVSMANAGELLHRELEDGFELGYSGLPSYLSQVQQVNISKLGIFTERQWPGQQNEFSTLYQMKSIIPTESDWYDKLNSTINYEEEVAVGEPSLALPCVTSLLYVEESNYVLVGGQGGVLSVNVNNLNIFEVNFTDISNQRVRQIFRNNDNIYILTDSYIYLSQDFGITWDDVSRDGLPNQLYTIGVAGNDLVIGASDGIYTKASLVFDWERSVETTSPVTVMLSSNLLYTVINGTIQVTSNGYSFSDTSVGSDLDIVGLVRYNYTNMYVAAKQGLYSDNGSLSSNTPVLTEINLSSFIDEDDTTINDVATDNSTKTVVGVSSGIYIIIENNVIAAASESTSLDAIHKLMIINDEIWLFGYNLLKVPFLNYPIRLSTGVPL